MIVEHFTLQPGVSTPNNATLPVMLYRRVLDGVDDMADAFETAFRRQGWAGIWHNGIFDYHHYHSRAHEALGIARGHGRVMLGGPGGGECRVGAGDCLLLPAGTGHCRIASSADFPRCRGLSAGPACRHADASPHTGGA
ncbi:MAG: cupin domain-containing protein [Rhizobium sp.]|nr:cupin domain-containing protein [Rhizobium sp.]